MGVDRKVICILTYIQMVSVSNNMEITIHTLYNRCIHYTNKKEFDSSLTPEMTTYKCIHLMVNTMKPLTAILILNSLHHIAFNQKN